MKRFLLVAIAIIVLAVAAVIFFLSSEFDQDLTVAPERWSESPRVEPRTAYVSIPFNVSFAALAEQLQGALPDPLVTIDETCKIKGRWRANCTGWIKLEDEVDISGQDGTLLVEIPVVARITAKTRGEIKIQETADTRFTVTVSIKPTIDEDWQPGIVSQATFRWDQRPTVKVFGVSITIAGLVEERIQATLDKKTTELSAAASEHLDLRKSVEKLWPLIADPIRVSETPEAWVVVRPSKIYFPPLSTDAKSLYGTLAMEVSLTTFFGPVRDVAPLDPVPRLTIEPPPSEIFEFFLPTVANYAAIESQLRAALAGKRYDVASGDRSFTVEFEDFAVYGTSAERIAVGARIEAESPNRLLNIRGWIYVVGRPEVERDDSTDPVTIRLNVAELGFTRAIDNPLVRMASWVFEGSILEMLEQALQVDVSKEYEMAVGEATRQLNRDLGKGVVLKGSLDELGVTDFQFGKDDLVIVTHARGRVSLQL